MTLTALATLLLAGALPQPASAPMTIVREHIVIRVPLPRRAAPTPAPMTLWKESKAPRCIDMASIAGAAIAATESVDFVLRGGKRVRAKLDRACPALDFYSGFYLVGSADGRICADRDAIRTRAGGSCEIERFRTLTAKPPR